MLELASVKKDRPVPIGVKTISLYTTLQYEVYSDGSVSTPTIIAMRQWENKDGEDKRKKVVTKNYDKIEMMDCEEM